MIMGFFDLPEYLRYVIAMLNLIVLILNIYCVVSVLILKAKKRFIFLNIGLLLCCAFMLLLLLSGNYAYLIRFEGYEALIELCNSITGLIFVGITLLTVLSLISLISITVWKQNNITPASIKQAMDKLPAGLCYYNEAGVPKLINHRMESLCRSITGEALFDGNDFSQRLYSGDVVYGNRVEKTGENPIITLRDNTTVSFSFARTVIGGQNMHEIRATDITKQYALNLELQAYNDELRSINRRLQEYGENVSDITREKEVLSAKIRIHDMLGKSLLITRRYIEGGDTGISGEEVSDIWRATIYLFDGGFAEKKEENGLEELYKAADIMGVRLNIVGTIPGDNQVLRFIMSGARECLTNAVHHAKAAELTVSLRKSKGYAVIEYTNDGIQPEAPISEGGGLSSLRQSVEAIGGIMEVSISPCFMLSLKIPSKEAY